MSSRPGHAMFHGLALSAITGASVLALASSAAWAANGDNLRTINADTTGTACADSAGGFKVGVGLAFDGASILVSCYNDSTVTAVSPLDGSQVAVHPIANASWLGALAWDNGRKLLWACSGFNGIGTIDLSTNVFTPLFSGDCFDGLAYDASDDTIWASADASFPVMHYTSAGVPIASFGWPAGWGGNGNSGIAVGGANLYMANDGSQQIYVVDKAFASAALFATFPARLEDMECDNLTFAGAGLGAIWSKDAYDNILNAWEIPTGTCAFGGGGVGRQWMTGGGSVFTETGVRVTHGFTLECDASSGGNLQVNWGKNRFHLDTVTAARCVDDASISPDPPASSFDTHVGSGTGRYNGVGGATIRWTLTDAGEPGTGDTASMSIVDAGGTVVLSVSGPLNSGNHQAHTD
jgi:hypothetical protein